MVSADVVVHSKLPSRAFSVKYRSFRMSNEINFLSKRVGVYDWIAAA